MTQPLMLPHRGRTYALMAAAVTVTLTLAVVLPLTLGSAPQRASGVTEALNLAPSPGSNLGTGPGTSSPTASPQPNGSATPQPTPSPAATATGPRTTQMAPLVASSAANPRAGGDFGGRPAAPGVNLTASDQGITPTTITIGAFIIDFGGANGLGAGVTGYDAPTQRKFIEAFRSAVNAGGGIGGRQLLVKTQTVDILNQQTMRDACTTFGETDRVFAVTQVLGVYGDPILKCAKDERLPFLATDGAVSSYYPAAGGYLFTSQPSTRRTILDMERRLVGLGELKGKKVGILDEDGYLKPDFDALEAALRRDGLTPVRASLSSSDSTTALRDIPTVAANFCQKGVDYVLLMVNSLYGSQFVSNIDRSPGCAPAYAVSDFDFAVVGDSFLKNMPASFFRRALAVTAGTHGNGRVGIAESAGDAQCRSIYESYTGTALDRNSAADAGYFDALAICQVIRNVVSGLTKAGPNPTRAGFVQALASLGSFDNANYSASHFAPGHTDAAGDAVRVSQAFGDCLCWKPQTAFTAP